jgi:hypothetical protein
MIQDWFAYVSYGYTVVAFVAGAIGTWWAIRRRK